MNSNNRSTFNPYYIVSSNANQSIEFISDSYVRLEVRNTKKWFIFLDKHTGLYNYEVLLLKLNVHDTTRIHLWNASAEASVSSIEKLWTSRRMRVKEVSNTADLQGEQQHDNNDTNNDP